MRKALLFGINFLITALTAASVGPAAFKMQRLFGLVGWAGRIPFYLLQLYIGAAIVLLTSRRPLTAVQGGSIGLGCTMPLVFWSIATHCAPVVQITYAVSGILQGTLLTLLTMRRVHSTPSHPS